MHYKKTILDNGLRILTVPMKENKTVTVMVLVEAGSRYEPKELNGISHFLEHMCFKGTTKRSSSLAITTEFDSLGAQYNAFTSGTYTGYYAKVAASKADQALEMVSDLYLNATLPEKDIEKEKGVVIEEMNMYEDQPQSKVWENLEALVYGDTPIGRTTIGTKETVSALSHAALESYRKAHYVPGKTLVVIAGGFDEKIMLEQVTATFGSIQEAPVIGMEKVVEDQHAPAVSIFEKKTDQTHLVLGFRSFSQFDPRVYAASLLRVILGGGMSSRLFVRLREELGLCYCIGAGHIFEHDVGLFTIAAGVSNTHLEKAVEEIVKELHRFISEGLTQEELQRAKDQKLGKMYLGLETSGDLADWYGFQEIEHEEMVSPEEFEQRLKRVTKEQVLDVAKFVFTFSKANLSVVGPHALKQETLLGLLA